MTCVIAMRDGNVIHMAADKSISGGVVNVSATKLVQSQSGMWATFAGSLWTLNVTTNQKEFHDCNLTDDRSIAALLGKFADICTIKMPPAPDGVFWTEMLLAQGDQLVYMGNRGGWHRVAEPVKALGDGNMLALGSWVERADLKPKERLERAIEVASLFLPNVVSKACDYAHT